MKKHNNSREDSLLGLDAQITRRDFIGSSLIGTGSALLAMNAPCNVLAADSHVSPQTIPLPLTGLGPEWTGPGGEGDYAKANGNTHDVVNAAHALRNGEFNKKISQANDTGEKYDLVVVGCGFAGLGAAYTYTKERPNDRVMMLDNHAIFGGEAKENMLEVDGYKLWGPQGSNGAVFPLENAKKIGATHSSWGDIGLPDAFEYQELNGTDHNLRVAKDVYASMHLHWEEADLGLFYENHGWVINPWKNGFKDAPIDESLKHDYLRMELYRQPPRRNDWQSWLDNMTYLDFLTNIMGLSPKVSEYLDPFAACMGTGLGADVISAYSAYQFLQPGVTAYHEGELKNYLASFPGGNSGIARHYVKKLIPGAIKGNRNLNDIIFNPVDWDALDRPNQPVRMRLNATVVDVRNQGMREKSGIVQVTYFKNGKLHRIKAKRVVLASGQWINKHIVKDLPTAHLAAMNTFYHAPILTVNVAVRNWRFMEKLGITAARWFEGFGWHTSLRRQLLIEGKPPMPLDPNKPTILTMYIPFVIPGLSVDKQTVAARMQLFGLTFQDIEKGVREQFAKMFSSYGFDPKRDIAGIVANRWGHAYVVQQPGFYFGLNGQPASRDIIRQDYGRIAFGHSELQGHQLWSGAVTEGERAARQVLEVI